MKAISNEVYVTVSITSDINKDLFTPARRNWGIFLVSVWGLFLEMLLIRWIGTEIRIFAYLQNTVLVVCFLGLGLGCLTSHKPIFLRNTLLLLFIFTLLMAFPLTRNALGSISDLLNVLGDVMIWANSLTANRWKSLIDVGSGLTLSFLIMIMLVEMFIPIGRLLGRLLTGHPNTIQAYSFNVAGSLVGTWLFVLLSFLYQPPFTWLFVLVALTIVLIDRSSSSWRLNLILLVGTVGLSWFAGIMPGSMQVVWSPYQKLVLWNAGRESGFREYNITVNNVEYQAMLTTKDPLPHLQYDLSMKGVTQYDIPFLLHPDPESALILGAGSGNDIAGALRHRVKSVTGVEIDPTIISFGRRYHPDKPYASPSVQLINDDARSFLATTKTKYDVISFGLLDSHTSTSMTNAPLDHYVYTRESIRQAKSLLADGGIMTLCFEAQKPFIADRMGAVLRDIFGKEPLCFRIPPSYYGFGGVMFIAGDLETARMQIAKNARLASLIEKWQREYPVNLSYTTRVTTDDWPYLFLNKPGIPLLYYLLAFSTALLVIRSRKLFSEMKSKEVFSREKWHFFFLGAGFLLLEVQNISKASVILGNTWQVNAVIVTGVFLMILAANLVANRLPGIPLRGVYLALFTMCLSLYFVDLSRFGFLPYAAKAAIVGGLTTIPMLFSGIIFINSFTGASEKDKALGANLIGALAGAMCQSVTFIIGIKALLLIVTAIYFLAMVTSPRIKKQTVKCSSEAVPLNL